jgi:hypothetical protein
MLHPAMIPQECALLLRGRIRKRDVLFGSNCDYVFEAEYAGMIGEGNCLVGDSRHDYNPYEKAIKEQKCHGS